MHIMMCHCTAVSDGHGKVLWRFVECLVKIRAYPKLEDEKWLAKLMFLVEITTHLNELNLCLQGVEQTVMYLFEVWKGFVSKLDVYTWNI